MLIQGTLPPDNGDPHHSTIEKYVFSIVINIFLCISSNSGSFLEETHSGTRGNDTQSVRV
jgi:hypothetical protein